MDDAQGLTNIARQLSEDKRQIILDFLREQITLYQGLIEQRQAAIREAAGNALLVAEHQGYVERYGVVLVELESMISAVEE